MVQKVRVELVCDACEEERLAERTVSYAFDGPNGNEPSHKSSSASTIATS